MAKYLLDRINLRLATTRHSLCLIPRRVVLLRSRDLSPSHVEGRRRATRSLEGRRGSGLRMLGRSIRSILLLGLWFCKQEDHRSGILEFYVCNTAYKF